MRKSELTPDQIQFILANYLTMAGSDIIEYLGIRKELVHSYMGNRGLHCSKAISIAARVKRMKANTTATPEVDEFIRQNYLQINVNQLAIKLGRSEQFVYTRLERLGLDIPAEIIAQRKIDSYWETGHIPANKGKKMSAQQYEKARHTMFKKGQVPGNSLYDGAITIRHNHKERGSPPYKHIRISPGKWEFLHRYIWQQANGPVPEGMVVVFKNSDTMNCDITNLEMITFEENMIRNSIHFKDYPEEIIKSAQAIALLNKSIKQFTK